ncbi:MAG: FHA domain-containing protein [Anaerolineales bacterium]|nr:FHA domain-containing protein [Anaerolineales bacterium]
MGLYAFLGWAFWTLYQDLVSQARSLSIEALPKLSLRVQNEPLPRPFQQLEVMIGRDVGCDLRLADSTVSGRHAKISFQQGQWWLEDLNSTNGTFLNQTRLTEPVVLTIGDEIRCGQVQIYVESLS